MNNDDSYNFTADNEDVLRDTDTILERIRGTPPKAPDGFSDTVRQNGDVPLSTQTCSQEMRSRLYRKHS